MLMTATGIFATGNTGIGFLIGSTAYGIISLYDFAIDVFS